MKKGNDSNNYCFIVSDVYANFYQQLLGELFKKRRYNSAVRPVLDDSDTVNVTIQNVLIDITEVVRFFLSRATDGICIECTDCNKQKYTFAKHDI